MLMTISTCSTNFGRDILGLQTFHPISVSPERSLGHFWPQSQSGAKPALNASIVSGASTPAIASAIGPAAGIPYANEQDPFAAVCAHQEVSLKQLIPGG